MKIRSWTIPLAFACLLVLALAPALAESRITAVSAGSGVAMALNDNGTIWTWGTPYIGGTDGIPNGLQPAIVPGVNNVVAMAGYMDPVVLDGNGTVRVLENYGILQNTSRPEMTYYYKGPVKINGLSGIIAISGTKAGGQGENLLALRNDGTVWAMGDNTYGQLGIEAGMGQPPSFPSYNPIQVNGLSNVAAISMGTAHAMTLKKDGTVWSWGMNDMGQLGSGTATQHPHAEEDGQSTPVMARGLTNVTAISAGDEFSLALKEDGTVWAWGRNDMGELGNELPVNVEYYDATPSPVEGLTNVTAIAAGNWYALALRADGTVWGWGDNRDGLLGRDEPEYVTAPVQIKGLSGIVSISAGEAYCLALDSNGAIQAWGNDYGGQLGDGSYSQDGRAIERNTVDIVPFSKALSGPEVKPSWMASHLPPVNVSLPPQDNNSIEYMDAINNTIYAFSLNGIMAMDGSGVPMWNISIPGAWTYQNAYGLITNPNRTSVDIMTGSNLPGPTPVTSYSTEWQTVKMVPTFATENGYVYLYALANDSDATYNPADYIYGMQSLNSPTRLAKKELIAVSPEGKIEWVHVFTDNIAVQDLSHVEAYKGRIYLYHNYNESVFDASGNLLFTINNIADPISVDENGNIYAMPAIEEHLASWPTALDGEYYDYRAPASLIEKYGPDGNLVWQKELPENATQPYFSPPVWNDNIGIPLYMNGMLYVPIENGTMALNKDGTPVWTKTLDGAYNLYYLMPTDSQGDVYLYYAPNTYPDINTTIVGIRPDGSELGRVVINPEEALIVTAYNGIIYMDGEQMTERIMYANLSPGNMRKADIAAYDLRENRPMWNFTTPIGETSTVTVNRSNVLTLFPDYLDKGEYIGYILRANSSAQIIPSDNLTYIYFRTAAWDEPVVYDRSTYTYYSALYAIDKSGKLVWQKPMNRFITAATANNSTIYYSTNGGGISIATIGIVAGVAIAGSLLVFFMLGSVTRARSKIDKNNNRNRIYRFIADRPGSTLYEMSKEMRLNKGTLRYHLMILGLNHRIVTYNDEDKFVRYFINSNRYSRDEQALISMMRRDTIGRIIQLLHLKPGLTNIEISSVIGLADSGVSRYLNELCDKGIALRNEVTPGRCAYSLTEEASKTVEKLYLVINGDGKARASMANNGEKAYLQPS